MMKISDRALVLYIAVLKLTNILLIVLWFSPYLYNPESLKKDPSAYYGVRENESENVQRASLGSHRRGLPRKLLERDIIYAPGHEPHESSGKGYNLTKARRYDVDGIQQGFGYVIVSSATIVLGFTVFVLIFLHTWKIRHTIAQDAYDIVYPPLLRKHEFRRRQQPPDFRGIRNLYMNGKIVSILWIFAFSQIVYQVLVLLCPVYMPKSVVCTPDPAWISLAHLPINMVAVVILFLAIFHSNYHAVMIHSVVTMYATMYFCMVLFGLASSREILCVQSIATQVMFCLTAWIYLWPPKIAGLASLRDRLAYEKMILKEHDKVELMRMREVTGSSREREYPSSSCSDEDIEGTVMVEL